MGENTLEVIQGEETLKLRSADLLKETVRLAGELRVNAVVLEDETLKELFKVEAKQLATFNSKLAQRVADLNK